MKYWTQLECGSVTHDNLYLYCSVSVTYLQPRATVSGVIEVADVDSPHSDTHDRNDLLNDNDINNSNNNEFFMSCDKVK